MLFASMKRAELPGIACSGSGRRRFREADGALLSYIADFKQVGLCGFPHNLTHLLKHKLATKDYHPCF